MAPNCPELDEKTEVSGDERFAQSVHFHDVGDEQPKGEGREEEHGHRQAVGERTHEEQRHTQRGHRADKRQGHEEADVVQETSRLHGENAGDFEKRHTDRGDHNCAEDPGQSPASQTERPARTPPHAPQSRGLSRLQRHRVQPAPSRRVPSCRRCRRLSWRSHFLQCRCRFRRRRRDRCFVRRDRLCLSDLFAALLSL